VATGVLPIRIPSPGSIGPQLATELPLTRNRKRGRVIELKPSSVNGAAQELLELLETLEPLWEKVLEAFKRYAEEEQ
jgi:hypothetical protein